jgi:hypothetical protein
MSGGMLNRIQWSQLPPGASGSSQMSTKLFVCDGAPLHLRGGETSAPSIVYREGIISSGPKALL